MIVNRILRLYFIFHWKPHRKPLNIVTYIMPVYRPLQFKIMTRFSIVKEPKPVFECIKNFTSLCAKVQKIGEESHSNIWYICPSRNLPHFNGRKRQATRSRAEFPVGTEIQRHSQKRHIQQKFSTVKTRQEVFKVSG